MEKIKMFINNVFASLPKTKEVVDMRNSIEQGMIEHYDDLIKEGKNEAEAFGMVVGEFGNIEDIRKELNVETREDMISSLEDIMMIDKIRESRKRKFSQFLVFGIISCVFAVFGSGAISMVADSMWSVIIFGFFGAIGAGSIVYGAIVYGGEEGEVPYESKAGHDYVKKSYGKKVAVSGGIVFPLTLLIYLTLGFVFDLWHPGWIVFIIAPLVVNIYAALASK